MGAPLADPCKIPDKVVRYKPPSKKPCTDFIREVVGYVWIRTDPHITGTIFARINPRRFHTCTP